jgi:hypothetical protein
MELLRDGLAVALVTLILYLGWARFLTARASNRDESEKQPSRPSWDEWTGPERASPHSADGDTYRANHSRGAAGWDPYAANQSRASRARQQRAQANARPVREQRGDHYTLLGVSRSASSPEIERAYRKHVAVIHPDRYHSDPGLRQEAETKLKQLNDAMKTLRDPELRARYDAQLREY